MVALLVFSLGIALAALSISHLQLDHRRQHAQAAHNQAASAIHKAMARVLADESYGTRGEALNDDLSRITFASDEPVYSTNNLESRGATTGWGGRVIPRQGLHLVSEASSRGVERTVEALYVVPPFPYAVASSSPVSTVGAVTVGGVEAAADLARLEDLILPADLVSNSAAEPAVRWGPGAEIRGDLLAVGPIDVRPGSVVEGRVRNGIAPVSVPRMSLDHYDPIDSESTVRLGPQSALPEHLTGLFRRSGSVQHAGPLLLDNGVLFVDGDLSIALDSRGRGGLHGVGAVISTGRVSIHGGSQFSEHNGVALLAREGVWLHGGGRESSFFQGLIYTEGPLEAADITLLGSLIVRAPEESPVVLREARAIHLPELTTIEVPEPLLFNVTTRSHRPGYHQQDHSTTTYTLSAAYDPQAQTLVLTPLSVNYHIQPGTHDSRIVTEFDHRHLVTQPQPLVLELTEEMLANPTFLDGFEFTTTQASYSVDPHDPNNRPFPVGERTVSRTLTGTERIRDYIQESRGPGSSRFSFDPNRFLKLSDKIRLVYWREL